MTTVLQGAQKPTTAVDQRPRVLIVDDDAVVRMLLEDICVEHGWNVIVAAHRGRCGPRRGTPAYRPYPSGFESR